MRVKVENYQAIKNAELKLDKGLIAIVGPTNSGKSSLIRAIKGAINNQRGTDFVTYDQDECRVTITENNNEIIWTKPVKKPATYTLNGREIAKVGVSQNEEVAELLNMNEVEIDGTKIRLNFWEQMEKAFLMDKTPQQLFGFISQSKEQELVKDYKDRTETDLSELNKEINTNTTKLDILSQDISRLKTRETDLAPFESFDIEMIEHLYNSRNVLETNLGVFRETQEVIGKLAGSISTNETRVNRLQTKLDEISKLIEEREVISSAYNIKTKLTSEYNTLQTNIGISIKNKGLLEQIAETLKGIITQHSELEEKRNKLESSYNTSKDIENEIIRVSNNIKALTQEREDIELELSGFEVCPFCGSDLSHESHMHDHQ